MRNYVEHDEQVILLTWTRVMSRKYPALRRLYANANAGTSDPRRGVWLRSEGVLKGVSDLFLSSPSNGFHGLYIELKSGVGRLTQEQDNWIKESKILGYEAEMCKGWVEAAKVIGKYLSMDKKDIPN